MQEKHKPAWHSKLQKVYCVHTIRFRLSVRILCLQQLETFWKAKQLYNHYQKVSIFILNIRFLALFDYFFCHVRNVPLILNSV